MSQDYRLTEIYRNMSSAKSSSFNSLTQAYSDVLCGLNEALLGSSSTTHASLPKYYANLNSLLANETPFPVFKAKTEVMFTPDSGQQVDFSTLDPKAALNCILSGTIDGVSSEIKVRHVVKTAEIKGKPIANRGQIMEGVLGAALFARLIARPNKAITSSDVCAIIQDLANHKVGNSAKINRRVNGVDHIADEFELQVTLKSLAMDSFLDPRTLSYAISFAQWDAVIAYANDTVRHYATLFEKNKKPDNVTVIADGVSHETTSKVDVEMRLEGEVLQQFSLSVKQGNTKIIGQRGSGGQTASRQKQFEILNSIWNEFGIDISSIRTAFEASSTLEAGYEVGYKRAARLLEQALQVNYSGALTNILKGIISFGTLNDSNVRLLQIHEKGYYVLNLHKIHERLTDDYRIKAKYIGDKAHPEVWLYDEKSKTPLLTIRTFSTKAGYVRTYIEKEELLIKLTKVRKSK